jgi:hypothetical protein
LFLLVLLLLERGWRALASTPLGRALLGARRETRGGSRAPSRPEASRTRVATPLVQCAKCGVHVPQEELAAAGRGGDPWCRRCRSQRDP